MKFCEFCFNKKHFNKVNLKEISEPQNIDHTTQSGLHTFWLVLAMVFGEMNFVMMLYVVPLSQKSFPSMQVLPGLISISILKEKVS